MTLSYTPLDDSKDEIRLLTLLPAAATSRTRIKSSIVHCRLDTRSLTFWTPEYAAFATDSTASLSSKRKAMADWSRSRAPPDHASIQDQGTPKESCYRFSWGDYAALSYVWGDEKKTAKIVVNGIEMTVTRNLERALRAFRDRSEFGGGFELWVDAICINQQDFEERGRQVRRMRDIYGNAWMVIAWLGEEAAESDKAVQLVRKLSECGADNTAHELEKRLRDDPEYLGDGGWYALNELMKRPYWSRLWIIQEIIMGASALVIRCGTSSIDWASFCIGIGVLQEHLWLVKDELLDHDVVKTRVQLDAVWSTPSLHLVYRDLSMLSQSRQKGLTFWRILDIANAAECRDPRDKVYGLVGLMDDKIAKQLTPDYTLAPHEVYAEVAKAFIKGYGNLEPIREGNPWGPTKTLSWVADWRWEDRLSLARIENQLWGPSWLSGNSVLDSSAYVPYQASGRSVYDISFPDNRLMTCSGFIVDSISGLSARGRGYFSWAKNSITQSKDWLSIYGDFEETSKALYRTLVADRVGRGQKSSQRHAAILNLPSTFQAAGPQFEDLGWTWLAAQERYYFRWEEWRKANRNLMLGERRLNDYFSDLIPLDASEYDFTEIYSCFDRTCQKRRFMLTKKGYMGWSPDNIYGSAGEQTLKGDLIAIMFGCSTPIVIRPYGELFKIVGEAYVQGMMDGEAMELLKEGKVSMSTFTFC